MASLTFVLKSATGKITGRNTTANEIIPMLPLIAEHSSEIAALCRRFGVRRLHVCGLRRAGISTQSEATSISSSNSIPAPPTRCR